MKQKSLKFLCTLEFKTSIGKMMNNNKPKETKKIQKQKTLTYIIRKTLRLINWPNYIKKEFTDVEIR